MKLRIFNTLVLLILAFVFAAIPARASLTVSTASLNGSSSVTVNPSASITASVTVIRSLNTPWSGTSWTVNGNTTCVDTPNYTGNGTNSESFTITAPAGYGTYDVSFVAYSNNGCNSGASSVFTLTGGIVVPTPTPTQTPTTTIVPTATPTSEPSGVGPTSPSQTYYPVVNFSKVPSEITTEIFPAFSGNVFLNQGTIELIEYSIDNGQNWVKLLPTDGKFDSGYEEFNFLVKNLTPNFYTVAVRAKSLAGVYTSENNYAKSSFTLIPLPPTVTLSNFSTNPTKNTTPTITGTVFSRFLTILKVEVSLDGGNSWIAANLNNGNFNFTTQPLEDGNYEIVARAFDSQGNMGISKKQTLVVDLYPPIIGGISLSLGPQILVPNENGLIEIVQDAEVKTILSARGGPTSITVTIDGVNFNLSSETGNNIWTGMIKFNKEGISNFLITAKDGAGNEVAKKINQVMVLKQGKVIDKTNGNILEGSTTELFYYENDSKNWISWDASPYGQQNPQSNEKIDFGYMVPKGKYYVEVKSPGYHTVQSQILEVNNLSVINPIFSLRRKPQITFNLPFIGKITLSISNFLPPDTNQISLTQEKTEGTEAIYNELLGKSAPNLILPDVFEDIVNITDFKGKKLVLVFIAPWSVYTTEQALILSELVNKLPSDSAILTINLQETISSTYGFMNSGSYKFPILIDKYGQSVDKYEVAFLPQTYFIDTKGIIKKITNGLLNENEILAELSKIQ